MDFRSCLIEITNHAHINFAAVSNAEFIYLFVDSVPLPAPRKFAASSPIYVVINNLKIAIMFL